MWIAKNNDQPIGAVMEATAPDGYSGAIQLLVAADFSGTVLGTRVTEHHETPGLGDKSSCACRTDHPFYRESHPRPWRQPLGGQKDGGDFDQFTGATITPGGGQCR